MFVKRRRSVLVAIVLIIALSIILLTCKTAGPHFIDSLQLNQISNKADNFKCAAREKEISIQERGNYVVYFNIVVARRKFKCDESITLTTMADFNFLDNIAVLVERWRGPISVALYAPGDDFMATLDAIAFYRNCETDLIKDLVSFHVYHDKDHFPKFLDNRSMITLLEHHPAFSPSSVDCSNLEPPQIDANYRRKNKLKYPVNVGRNVARLSAETHFVLASDIELYPTLNIIENFLKLIAKQPKLLRESVVFVLPVFEMEMGNKVPDTKTELRQMFNRTAFSFHEKFCRNCHDIPGKKTWIQTPDNGGLNIFARVKRVKEFKFWEPLYIGTQAEPLYDERIYWEGGSDKMVQAYALCLLDYDFAMLDNAFLMHRPGIKEKSSQNKSDRIISLKTMQEHIEPEMNALYGKREECVMYLIPKSFNLKPDKNGLKKLS